MTKRIPYKIGDIFLVPLEGNLKGVGRLLKNNQATIFIELYYIKPITDFSEFNYEDAIKKKPITLKWCYDDGLISGEWQIVDYKPVEGEIEMPYFWTQDAGNKKYYVSKGTDSSYRTHEEQIEIPKDDINKYEPYGIGNKISERNRYIKRLREAGLM